MSIVPYISLSKLSEKIKDAIAASFSSRNFWVVADVVDHKFYPDSRRHYFGLVERNSEGIIAKVKATAGDDASGAIGNFEKSTGQRFMSGINVLINVSVSYHELYGLQIALNDIDTNYTIGQLAKYKEQTIERLLAEVSDKIERINGQLISYNRKLSLPVVIQKIALISSHSARGFEDFMDSVKKNERYKLDVDVYFSSVQGENNVNQLVDSLVRIYNSSKKYDAVVIVRGGGSDTDFLIFDHFSIARAITRFPIPIVVGIGHQINETISDLVAHTSVNTPSSAAEFIVRHNRKFEDGMFALRDRIRFKLLERVRQEEEKISSLKLSISQRSGVVLRIYREAGDRCRDIIIRHARAIISQNSEQIVRHKSIVVNRPHTLIARNRAMITEVHSTFGQRCNLAITRNKEVFGLSHRSIVSSIRKILDGNQRSLTDTAIKTGLLPYSVISGNKNGLNNIVERLKTSSVLCLQRKRDSLRVEESMCRLMSPMNILKKGFAIVYAGEKVIVGGNGINISDNLRIRLADTKIDVTVTDKTQTDGNEFDL